MKREAQEKRVVSAKVLEANQGIPEVVIPPGDAKMLVALQRGESPEEAAREAGMTMSPVAAASHASYLEKRYNGVMIEALQRAGATVDAVAVTVAQQLRAKKHIRGRGGLLVPVPDHTARQQAVDTVLDILPGARAPKQMQIETRSLEAIIMQIKDDRGGDDEW